MSHPESIRVLVVDDHPMFADAVSALLTRDGRFDVVGTATKSDEAIEVAEREDPHVILMDLTMPDADAIATAHRLHDACPDARLVILSGLDEPKLERAARDAGADAWLSKDGAHTQAADLIASVAARA
jgi:two-component system NarL family response regulator